MLRSLKAFRPQRHPVLAAAHIALDETSRFEHSDVAGHPGECHRQRRGEIGDAGIAGTQRLDEVTTRRVGQCGVGTVQDLIFNHLVDYSRPEWFSEVQILN